MQWQDVNAPAVAKDELEWAETSWREGADKIPEGEPVGNTWKAQQSSPVEEEVGTNRTSSLQQLWHHISFGVKGFHHLLQSQ